MLCSYGNKLGLLELPYLLVHSNGPIAGFWQSYVLGCASSPFAPKMSESHVGLGMGRHEVMGSRQLEIEYIPTSP